ncbi:MAG: DUF4956 domain-containing protein [Butyrivibrio sp.]|nr:DUF4956 domain-containing protein [Butyrivibrio sp.]
MREFIVENLISGDSLSMATIVMNNVVSILIAFLIMFTYKITYTGASFSKNFCVSLGAIILVTTMIMSVISNNVALSLGMVGALSIIRFRTAVKDVKDATFIFWCIAAGIGCGVSQYALVAVGSIFVMLFYFLTRSTAENGKMLLVIQSDPNVQNEVLAVIDDHFGNKAHLTMKNMTDTNCEMIFTVSERLLDKANEKHMIDVGERLLKIEGVHRFNQVEQQDSISR